MYRELVVEEVAKANAEALSDALLNLGALSVSIEDSNADTLAERPIFWEPGLITTKNEWEHSRLIALFNQDYDPLVLLIAAINTLGLTQVPSYLLRDVADQDWVHMTQSKFEPISIGKNIWVVQSWHSAPKPSSIVIELDPGLAFGTGSHPTTRLCMEWLEEHIFPGQSLLDYGCGSGILAILAQKCGAQPVIGIDIDPQALLTARDNSERNQVTVEYHLPSDLQKAQFNIVIANILSNPLKLLASILCGYTARSGRLALSGVLEHQVDEVILAYAPYMTMKLWRMQDGWACLHGEST
ncbi:50S ribosomal protein L11 methyltransferase [Candidatus Pandoraea novymonadis]|nr:50S ribosomal protein L11 methyltransferase [Candidatus Pandoraea novymonadis]